MLDKLEICSFLVPERVISKDSADKEQLMNELLDLIASDPLVEDAPAMRKAVWKREKELSTGIGEGIAIPHARTEGVKDFVVAFAKIRNGVDFDALDKKPVHFVFMIVANVSQDKNYIKLLSRLMLRMRNPELINSLMKASDSAEIYKILSETK